MRPSMRSASGVYPRVCGGALEPLGDLEYRRGLSPRVRGSHLDGELHLLGPGSIPACAGEP